MCPNETIERKKKKRRTCPNGQPKKIEGLKRGGHLYHRARLKRPTERGSGDALVSSGSPLECEKGVALEGMKGGTRRKKG
jgi:hypothetical protein